MAEIMQILKTPKFALYFTPRFQKNTNEQLEQSIKTLSLHFLTKMALMAIENKLNNESNVT
jgi:hypothetical protein